MRTMASDWLHVYQNFLKSRPVVRRPLPVLTHRFLLSVLAHALACLHTTRKGVDNQEQVLSLICPNLGHCSMFLQRRQRCSTNRIYSFQAYRGTYREDDDERLPRGTFPFQMMMMMMMMMMLDQWVILSIPLSPSGGGCDVLCRLFSIS